MGVGLALMAWLTPGPREVGGVVLDVHTMLFGSLGIIMGYQTLWLWAYARIYGWTSGMLPRETFLATSLRAYQSGTRLSSPGLAMLAAGLGLNGWLFFNWIGQNMGPLDIQVYAAFRLVGLHLHGARRADDLRQLLPEHARHGRTEKVVESPQSRLSLRERTFFRGAKDDFGRHGRTTHGESHESEWKRIEILDRVSISWPPDQLHHDWGMMWRRIWCCRWGLSQFSDRRHWPQDILATG